MVQDKKWGEKINSWLQKNKYSSGLFGTEEGKKSRETRADKT